MTKEQIINQYTPLDHPANKGKEFSVIRYEHLYKAMDEWAAYQNQFLIARFRNIAQRIRGIHDPVLTAAAANIDAALASYTEEAPPTYPNEHPDQALFDQYSEIKKKIGELGYLSFISSKEVEEYRKWLRTNKYKHRLEWFEKEYPNGLYSQDEEGNFFGINILTKKFLDEADAAWEGQVTGKSAGEGDGIIEESDPKNTSKIKESVAAKIDAQIRSLGLNKLEFSRLMGVPPSTITKWLSGNHNFELRTLCEIEKRLNLPLINYRIEPSGEAGKQPEQQPADPWIPLKSWDKQGHLEAGKDFLFLYDTGEIRRRDEEEHPFAGLTHYMEIPSTPGSAQTEVPGEQKGGEA